MITKLVAALSMRVNGEKLGHPLSWAKLGSHFDLTQDQIRHRLNTFKKKYNIVDEDVTANWNRTFLAEHASEDDRNDLRDSAFWPGDTVNVRGGSDPLTVIEMDEEHRGLYGLYNYSIESIVYAYGEDMSLIDPSTADVKIEYRETTVIAKKTVVTEKPQHLILPNTIIVVRDGQPLTINKDHRNFDKIEAALKSEDWGSVFDLIDLKNTLTKYSNGRVSVEDGSVKLDGETFNGKLADRLLEVLLDENISSLDALSNFLQKSDDNPDARVLNRLFSFMKAKDIRIDKDGDFYAYKVVRSDYMDKHSNTMLNKPGEIVKMKRNKVNPIDSETCSHGLHVCSKSYIKHFSGNGDRVVLCKVNPKDVVSVPTDYGDAKMRVCEYYVVKDVTENFGEEVSGIEA